MGLSGYSCIRNGLAALNVMYILISILLISVAAYAKASAIVSSISIAGGIIACGVFLFLIAVMGLIGAMKHHQICLFFYMLILFVLFIIQFSIAVTCLAVSLDTQQRLIVTGWNNLSPKTKTDLMQGQGCCGFKNKEIWCQESSCCGGSLTTTVPPSNETVTCCSYSPNNVPEDAPTSSTIPCDCHHRDCYDLFVQSADYAVKMAGAIGLVFSFTEIFGVILARNFRNQRKPMSNMKPYF